MSQDPEDKRILKRMKEERELLAKFGAKLHGSDPGVTAYFADVSFGHVLGTGNGYFGEQLNFSAAEWKWLRPLLEELRDFRNNRKDMPMNASIKPPMEFPQILQQVTRLLGKHLEMWGTGQIKPEDTITGTLKMDSLSAVEFVLSLEDLFKVELPDEVVEGAKTVEDIARRVEEQLLAQGRVADHTVKPVSA